MPAQKKSISSERMPRSAASSLAVCCTLWHKPTVWIDWLLWLSAQVIIAIGLT